MIRKSVAPAPRRRRRKSTQERFEWSEGPKGTIEVARDKEVVVVVVVVVVTVANGCCCNMFAESDTGLVVVDVIVVTVVIVVCGTEEEEEEEVEPEEGEDDDDDDDDAIFEEGDDDDDGDGGDIELDPKIGVKSITAETAPRINDRRSWIGRPVEPVDAPTESDDRYGTSTAVNAACV